MCERVLHVHGHGWEEKIGWDVCIPRKGGYSMYMCEYTCIQLGEKCMEYACAYHIINKLCVCVCLCVCMCVCMCEREQVHNYNNTTLGWWALIIMHKIITPAHRVVNLHSTFD